MMKFWGKVCFGFIFILSVNSQEILIVPSTEVVYETQRASVLPMTLECPSLAYKFIEVRGVTLVNDTNVVIAKTVFPNIDRATNEECLASLMQPTNDGARCTVSMNGFVFDNVTKEMDKVVTYDCRKTIGGDSAGEIKTISKKKGTINIKCPDKESVPVINEITLASGKYVNVLEAEWKCNEENIDNMGKGKGGGCCQIHRNGYLNDSEMTVKYRCSAPPKRNVDEFVEKEGRRRGNQKNRGSQSQ